MSEAVKTKEHRGVRTHFKNLPESEQLNMLVDYYLARGNWQELVRKYNTTQDSFSRYVNEKSFLLHRVRSRGKLERYLLSMGLIHEDQRS